MVTVGVESRVLKVWTLVGTQLGSVNIDMPLPYQWDIYLNSRGRRVSQLRETYKVLKEIYHRIRFEKELEAHGGNVEDLMAKAGYSKRLTYEASNRAKLGSVRGLVQTLRGCGMNISAKEAKKTEQETHPSEPEWQIEEAGGGNESDTDRSRLFKTEVKTETPVRVLVHQTSDQTADTKVTAHPKKDFKTMHDLLVYAKGEERKLKSK